MGWLADVWCAFCAVHAGGVAAEYPPLSYLYDDFDPSLLQHLYGFGFGYSRRLSAGSRVVFEEHELLSSLLSRQWDLVVYGRVGPDEDREVRCSAMALPLLLPLQYTTPHYNTLHCRAPSQLCRIGTSSEPTTDATRWSSSTEATILPTSDRRP